MTVIMVLMNDHDRRRAIDHEPFFLAGSVDHPVVPACAADGEIRNVCVTGLWKKEKIASRGTMESALRPDDCFKLTLPPCGKFEWSSDVQIPALAKEYKPSFVTSKT